MQGRQGVSEVEILAIGRERMARNPRAWAKVGRPQCCPGWASVKVDINLTVAGELQQFHPREKAKGQIDQLRR